MNTKTADVTQDQLLALVCEMAILQQTAERIRMRVDALSRRVASSRPPTSK